MVRWRRTTRAPLVIAMAAVLSMSFVLLGHKNTTVSVVTDLQNTPSPLRFSQLKLTEGSAPSQVRSEEEEEEWSDPPGARREANQERSARVGQVSRGEAAGQEARQRAHRLLKACQHPDVRRRLPARLWTVKHKVFRPFPVCFVPKGGSTSWRSLMQELSQQVPGSRMDLKTVVARHPLSRLASVYRDKFLNGSSLRSYNETFKRVTESGQTWLTRWKAYWLPALIHKGLVKPSPRFLEMVNETSEAYKFVVERVDSSGRLRLNASSRAASGFSSDLLKLARKMVSSDGDLGMMAAVDAGYPGSVQIKLRIRFMSSSFTFVEFLDHVVWTWEIGLIDPHWTPVTHLCDPCRAKYRYVLHLENPEESSYLFGLLQSRGGAVPRRHTSIGASPDHSDLRYFKHVPQKLMDRILKLYRLDFLLFGYSETRI